MPDNTDTAICITREIYAMDPSERPRVRFISSPHGYGEERARIKFLATVFDAGYNALTENEKGGLGPWDLEIIPALLHRAADWATVTPERVTMALAVWPICFK